MYKCSIPGHHDYIPSTAAASKYDKVWENISIALVIAIPLVLALTLWI